MHSSSNYPIQSCNSFNIKATCPKIYFPSTIEDLYALPEFLEPSFYVLGEGSNTLFVESNTPIVIKPQFKGVEVVEREQDYVITVGAAENWHDLVLFCIENDIYGLENLALIPGSVGAAPVQNIGAYGVEISDFCLEVHWYDFKTKKVQVLTKQECQFSYRDSIFKQSLCNRGLIFQVVFKIPKNWQANISYGGLELLGDKATAKTIMAKVIQLREGKLPNPHKLPNAGSFFKNPVLNSVAFERLQKKYPNIPNYPQTDKQVKIAAGWLIEQAGLKGFRYKGVGVHEHQALVLVNYSEGKGSDIIDLAKYVQQQVLSKFAVKISPEVRMVSAKGEVTFESLRMTLPLDGVKND